MIRVPIVGGVGGGLKKSGNLKFGNVKPEKPTLDIMRIAAKIPTPAYKLIFLAPFVILFFHLLDKEP